MTSIDVFELRYTKVELATAPQADRVFFLLTTALANDIQILTRQYVIAIRDRSDMKVQEDGASAVAMLNLKLLCGRFREGWKLIADEWSKIAADYEPNMSPDGMTALADLRSHFQKKWDQVIVFQIRDKLAFHADAGFVNKRFDELPDDTDMHEYLGEKVGDTLFMGCEAIHMRSLVAITGRASELEAFGAVMDEVRKLQNLFINFVYAFARVFAQRWLPRAYVQVMSKRKVVANVPHLDDLRIPYFADFVPKVRSSLGG